MKEYMKIKNSVLKKVEKSENGNQERKIYNQPEIIKLGAMQRVTLGGTPGAGDSGSPATQNLKLFP